MPTCLFISLTFSSFETKTGFVLFQSTSDFATVRKPLTPLRSAATFPFGLLVSLAARDADELLDAAGVPQGFGVLHVLGDDLVQRAADRSDGVVRHGLPPQDAAVDAAASSCSSSSAAGVVVVAASG